MKQALIYDPYLDTLGGGERYTLTFATVARELGHGVTFAWPDKRTLSDARERFNLETDYACDAVAFEVFSRGSLKSKFDLTRKYDLVFFVSDGSLPFLFAKKNLVHFQVPFKKIGGNPVINLVKTLNLEFVFNSLFTANIIRPQLPGGRNVIIYPPIDVESFVPGKKEDLILSVARFDSPSHAKRQDVLIEAFAKLREQNKKYKLIFAGGLKGEGGEKYLSELKEKAKGLPITFIPNLDFDELKKLYAKAKIFWHAAGYGVDEKEEPERVEHFGMTTVEAMAAGAIPVVIDKGGQREIITSETGFLCQSPDEIVDRTLSLIKSPDQLKQISLKASERAQYFSIAAFGEQVKSLL